MIKPSQRPVAAVILLLLGVALCWWWAGRGGPEEPMNSRGARVEPLTSGPETVVERLRPATAAARPDNAVGESPEARDRFADAPVLEESQTERREAGVTTTQRVRLIRKQDFKYPLIRVVDELVADPQGSRRTEQTAMVGDHVLVKLRNGQIDEAAFVAKLLESGGSVRHKMPASRTWLVAFDNPTVDTVPKALISLAALNEWVQYAEPDYIVHALAAPNDPSFGSLWGLHNTGQNAGVADVDVDAPEAWDLHTGSAEVVVAVIDSGIDQSHPDLVGNLWTNPGEIAGNGVDDDGNGYVDDVRGWDFVNNDNLPADDNSHGTHCAGTIGAVGNNAAGVAGVCWDVSLVALKFLDANGNGSLSDGIEAISYATRLGVTLTSNSWGGGGFSEAMKEAIDEADAAGILFVAAAGNSSSNMEVFPGYPASYPSANVISVAALTRTGALAGYSNYGITTTDVAAPGSEIYSTMPGGGYGEKSGTSMAAPHVAGACALLKSYRRQLSHSQVKDVVMRSVDVVPGLESVTMTGGRLNLYSALLAADDILVSPGTEFEAKGPVGGPFVPNQRAYSLTNHSTEVSEWTATVDQPWVSLSVSGGALASGASAEVQATFNSQAAALLAGDHEATITFTSLVTGRTQPRQVKLRVLPPPLYVFDMDSDPGWTRTGAWAFGTPTGKGGAFYGVPDPVSGHTGSQVFGVNLNGDYATTVGAAHYLTAGPFNLTGHRGATLRYQRWLNSDYQPWVWATVEVSTDQVVWHRVWDNGTSMRIESSWTEAVHDLSAYTDDHPEVYVRWGHQVKEPGAYPLSGWNLDDVEILAMPDRQLRLILPPSLTEGGGAGQGKVTVAPVPETDLTIHLSSSRPGAEVAFPESVVIRAGQGEATFELTPVDDDLADGTQTTWLTVSAATFPPHSASVQVHDNEAGVLMLVLPEEVSEGAGTEIALGEVRLPVAAEADVVVYLTSSDTSELTVPKSVTIQAGDEAAVIPLAVMDDILIDGTQTVTITTTVVNWPAATASIQVLDNEPRVLTLMLPASGREGDGLMVNGGAVSVPSPVETQLTVALVSSHSGKLTLPAQVVIAARTSSVTFHVNFEDDDLEDGKQTVQVQATAEGFVAAAATVVVEDDDVPAIPIEPAPNHGAVAIHPETDLSWQFDPTTGGMPASYDVYLGTNEVLTAADFIGASATASRALPRLTPGLTYYWQVVAKKGTSTAAGPVWAFTVAPVGPPRRLDWTGLPNAVATGVPFNARVTAYDDYDNPVDSFTDSASLATSGGAAETTTGTGGIQWEYPFATYFHDARTQSIYLPSEVGSSGVLTSLALDVAVLPGQTLKELTIRLKHTSKNAYLSPSQINYWEDGTGWTTVYSATTTITGTGWKWFVFTTPFAYDGVKNLMVDISFNNTSYTTYGRCRATPVSDYRSLAHVSDSNPNRHPKDWDTGWPLGTSSLSLPNLRFRRSELTVPVIPAVIGPFVNGTWSGELILAEPGVGVRIEAQGIGQPTVSGVSHPLDVVTVPILALNEEPLYSGGTENRITWNSVGEAYQYEIERSAVADFSETISSGVVAATEHAFAGLVDGQTYHYRGRVLAGEAAGQWSLPVRSTQDATAPTIQCLPASGGVVVGGALMLRGAGIDETSGVGGLTVDGTAAATADGFAEWEYDLAELQEGQTTVTLMAHDKAVPPNVRVESWTVTRIGNPGADEDRNGVTALLEYAFNASGPEAAAALPRVSAGTETGASGRSLLLTYRRRLVAGGLDYVVETSRDLTRWESAAAYLETVSVTPAGDGVTENVTLRIQPPGPEGPAFVRVRVVMP